MEGQGVTNYSTEKPSYAFSAATTEFDDALMKRGIITHQQAIVAKGASVDEASRLVSEANFTTSNSGERQQKGSSKVNDNLDDNDYEDEDDFLDDEEDDDFLTQYRQKRIRELQQEQGARLEQNDGLLSSHPAIRQQQHGEAVLISRPEWNREVNDASERTWVVVCLTASDTERTGCVERAVRELASFYVRTKFVLIASASAISNWPDENLPTLFLYRHGKLQDQLVGLNPATSTEQLERILGNLQVLEDNE